jgi:carboxymethylenebutenolidase
MGAVVQLTADDGHVLDAYRAAPEGEAKAGLVLVQEIFGVNDHIRGLCDDFAARGYLVLAPALFDRKKPGIELGYTSETVEEGRTLKADIGWEGPVQDIKAGVDALEGAPKIAVVGYCWGGSLAWLSACRLSIDAAVGYYGGQIIQFIGETPTCPTMLHFGTEDSGIPIADVDEIKTTHPDVAVHVYQGAGHGFSCDQRADYDADASKLALDRTLAHLGRHLG